MLAMAKFRKKPVVIEALPFDGTRESLIPIMAFTKDLGLARTVDAVDGAIVLRIDTLEGTMTVSPGDWVIRGVQGEFYPCKPDIFAATYEPVEERDGPTV